MEKANSKQFDYLFKIVLIGDSSVGKTNLLSQLIHKKYIENSRATIGVEFGTMTFNIENKIIKAQIWDTAGQERYQAITHAYYRGSSGSILVYDVTEPSTLKKATEMWLIQLKNYTEDIPIMLVGNKIDLNRKLKTEDGKEEALRNGLMFYETSAKTGENIQEAFFDLIKVIYQKQKDKEAKQITNKGKSNYKGREVKDLKPKKKKGCC